jgi:AraC-like DNA-binding protein
MRSTYRRQVFPRHTHEYFTLGVMLRGVGTLWYRGAERTAHRGDVVLIPPGEVHTGGMGRDTKVLSYLAVHVPADVLALRASANDFGGGRVPDFVSPVIRDPDVSAALRRLDSAMRIVHGAKADSLMVEAPAALEFDDAAADDALTTAIDLLVRRHADSSLTLSAPSPSREPTLVRVVRDIIEDCYADRTQTSLRALAQRTGVTPFHLVRVFTRTMGLSPHRFVVQTRVRRARQLLASGIPSSFVAAMTGFVDQSHLTTQFKRYVGTTPVCYQRCLRASLPGRASTPSR